MNVDMHHRVLAMEDPPLVLNKDPVQLYSHDGNLSCDRKAQK